MLVLHSDVHLCKLQIGITFLEASQIVITFLEAFMVITFLEASQISVACSNCASVQKLHGAGFTFAVQAPGIFGGVHARVQAILMHPALTTSDL
jgi:hypothetical protein